MLVKQSVANPGLCGSGDGRAPVFLTTFSHVVYVTPGGAETELYDVLSTPGSNGLRTVSSSDCAESQGADRGLTFHDRNGLGLRFEADNAQNHGIGVFDLAESSAMSGSSFYSAAGNLYFRNGTNARVDAGRITSLQDRAGNRVSFCYSPCTQNAAGQDVSGTGFAVAKITDALGRVYEVDYAHHDPGFGTVDRIRFRPKSWLKNPLFKLQSYSLSTTGIRVGGITGIRPRFSDLLTSTEG